MGVESKVVLINSVNYLPYYWEDFRDLDDEILAFHKENPMPKNKLYRDIEELINDFNTATGVIALPLDIEEEFLYWIEELIEYLSD